MPPKSMQSTAPKQNRSVDSLLADLKGSPSVDKPFNSAYTRRKDVDRRNALPVKSKNKGDKFPRGTAERRADSNRRAKKNLEKKSKAEVLKQQNELKLQQHRKRILLAGCEPVMGYNFNSLAMDDYPDNALVSAARRDRDYWLMICSVFGSLFFLGLIDIVTPVIAGVGAGLSFLSAIFAFTPFRKYFFSRPHLHELLMQRKKIEFTALNHIRFLEGKDGLAWRCGKLQKYNSNLKKKLFSGIIHFSKQQQLLQVVKNKKHIRLYLLLMIESQKAYKRLEKDYLKHHFNHLEQGWDDQIDENEASKLEQSSNLEDKPAAKP